MRKIFAYLIFYVIFLLILAGMIIPALTKAAYHSSGLVVTGGELDRQAIGNIVGPPEPFPGGKVQSSHCPDAQGYETFPAGIFYGASESVINILKNDATFMQKYPSAFICNGNPRFFFGGDLIANPETATQTITLSAQTSGKANNNQVKVSWSKITDAQKYEIQRNNNLITTNNADTTTYTDQNLATGVYEYKVDAYNSAGAKIASGTTTVYVTSDQVNTGTNAGNAGTNGTQTEFGNAQNLGDYISNVFTWVIHLAEALAVLMLVYAGYLYMTSQGNPDGINQAKDIIIGVVTGIILLFLIEVILVKTIGMQFKF